MFINWLKELIGNGVQICSHFVVPLKSNLDVQQAVLTFLEVRDAAQSVRKLVLAILVNLFPLCSDS